MSVLSLSEIQYIGDQSLRSKPTEDMVEEPTFPHADRQQPRPVENLLLATCDRKQTALNIDFAQRGDDAEQIHTEKDGSFKNVTASLHSQTITLLDGMHADHLQEGRADVELTNHHKESTDCSAAKIHLAGVKLSNNNLLEEDSFCIEDCNNVFSTVELHSLSNAYCLGEVTYSKQEQRAKLTAGLNSTGRIPLKDVQRERIDGSGLDESCNLGFVETDISYTDGDNKDHACVISELTSLASSNDSEAHNVPTEGHGNNILSSTGSDQLMEKMELNVQNGDQEGELGTQVNNYYNYLEQDHAVALWVKWRGKWQTGIRCPRADCSLSALRAKPTHERKRYIPVFFPRTRTYCWADMLLVRSIDELPEPLVRGSHRRWRKLVKDLTLPHWHIMQKLAVAMLNIGDQLHTEAVIENARKATAWKEFAMEASQCRDYADLGRMLLKLETMILPHYVNRAWLVDSYGSWKSKCQNAQSAESIEILTEELMDSVLWMKVNELWSAPMQPELSLEWKTWKQEAMKYFFSSYPTATVGDMGPNNVTNSLVVDFETSRKRPKLEVLHAETYISQMESPTCKEFSQVNMVEADLRHFNCQEVPESAPCQPCKVENLSMMSRASESHTLASPCNQFVDECKDTKVIQIPQVGTETRMERGKAVLLNDQSESNAPKKYRQCLAFVPSKGRQCGRWANDGDIYCCVHLNAHYAVKFSHEGQKKIPVEAQMCEGTTTHGRKCKHRARLGSTFCKKHQFLRSHETMYSDDHSSGNTVNRNRIENLVLESFSSSNIVHDGHVSPKEIQATHENLVPVVVGVTLDERNCLMKKSELYNALPAILPRCIGNYLQNNGDQCLEYAKRHSLYCDKHLPKFLKRARNGKSRLVSKDIFLNLLKKCNSREEKLCLHQACELLYGFMRNGLSRQRPVSRGDMMSWILSEATKDQSLGECLLKLVSSEREKLSNIWGFNTEKDRQISPSETNIMLMPMVNNKDKYTEPGVKCKICAEVFASDHKLGMHWREVHKKEARWLFRGYACAVCMTSFINRKVLETHVKERHGVQFIEHSIIFRCISCNSHFVSSEQLWQHILSSHAMDFRIPDLRPQSLDQSVQPKIEIDNKLSSISEKQDGTQKVTCRLCGLRFDHLPDLGRHHQVAHMNPNSISQFSSKRGSYHLKHDRHYYPRLKKNLDAAYRFKNRVSFDISKHITSSHSVHSVKEVQTQASESLSLGRLLDIHCSGVAETLFSEIQKTKPRPSSLEILSIARSACCRTSFNAALEVKYGILQENLYLTALKLCSELNIEVGWHLEGFICPKGCSPSTKTCSLSPLHALKHGLAENPAHVMDSFSNAIWEMDESHYILNLEHLYFKSKPNGIILCEDVSFGRESVPVACVVDEHLKECFLVTSHEASDDQEHHIWMPWKAFNYVTKRLIGPSLSQEAKDQQLGCKCPSSVCNPENCDHVYLFDDDHVNAKDVNGNSMHSRFAYDEKGRIVLEEGHLVYECNSMCKCDATCPNRVLQKGIQVKLEIFRTEKKGWAVRAGEAISRGSFVCEYIGEVLNDHEASRWGERYDSHGCSYLYDIDAHIDCAQGLTEGTVPYVIDATKHGNVSRFINHSCSPNLMNYLVLVDNMDCQLARVGLYASRDIAIGEELAYDYRSKLVPGEGHPCHCGASNCRGRLY
ncbi:histone-lysine N-methyltransferase SUVR5 isoform X1 [Musa acuminata AAA Group]|uniref:histone-lysine N-methyltransferase SUVR5 isoform X1 n=1 Tax=Musa acuminata AAA Group TaxID=214697 RepID=UPI0031CFF1C2